MLRKSTRRATLIAFAALAGTTTVSRAADFPDKPLRWIVAYAPGGGSDFLARTVAARLSTQLRQPIVIDNRPGAATIVGAQVAAAAPGDGYTLFTADNGSLVFNPALYAKLPYKVADFAPIGLMARFPLLLVTTPSSGFASAQAMIEAAKADPAKLSFASPGAGGPHHLAMELLKVRAGFDALHVAYKGAGPAVQDVLSGQVPVMILDTATALPHLEAGKLKALAVASTGRLARLSDVPTFRELGYEGVEVYAWQGLVVPAATPGAIRDRLTRELQAALADPMTVKALTDFGLEVTPSNAAQMAAFTEAETARWHALIRQRGLKLDQ